MDTGATTGGVIAVPGEGLEPSSLFQEVLIGGDHLMPAAPGYEVMLQANSHGSLPHSVGVSSNLSSPTALSVSEARSTTDSPAMSVSMGSPTILHLQSGTHLDKICLVCGDEALGKHFGVLTCEACKSFFRRSVRQSAQYFCRYNRNCAIQKHTRNKCQYCRYQKCIGVGMQIDAVQEERNPTNVKPRPAGQPMMAPQVFPVGEMSPSQWQTQASAAPGSTLTPLLDGNPSAMMPSASSPSTPRCVTLPMLLQAERVWPNEPRIQMMAPATSFDDIVKSTKDQLYYAIEWAKMVQPFVELPLEDQVVVLKCVWNELLTLRLAFRPSPVEDALVLGTGQLLYRNQGDADIKRLVGRFFDEIVTPCKSMSLEMAELVCMKALVLFNPDCPKLRSSARIEAIQEQCMELLNEYCRARFPAQKLRFSKILLRLSAVRSITTETRDYLVQQKTQKNANIDSFVLEMLDA